MNNYEINWSDIVFKSKKVLRDLNAIFIAPSREISTDKFKQIIKEYLPLGNIVLAITSEEYICGFECQEQFKTLNIEKIITLINKVNSSNTRNKIYTLNCKQSDIVNVYEKIKFKKVLLVNGSWQYSFHVRPEYYKLVSRNIPFEYISPFASEPEAIKYAESFKVREFEIGKLFTDKEMINLANESATNSFGNEFQTGVVLGKKQGNKYKLLAASYNKVVPYQAFAWHYGALREKHLSPPGDLNYYDTIHAEMNLLISAQNNGINVNQTTLFTNLLPCPHCAKVLSQTNLSEIVYSLDHSDGYAVALLEKSGKKVRRLINNEKILNDGGSKCIQNINI